MRKFLIVWPDESEEIVTGTSAEDGLINAGYSAGAVFAINWHAQCGEFI